jgi:hypothetical protein
MGLNDTRSQNVRFDLRLSNESISGGGAGIWGGGAEGGWVGVGEMLNLESLRG